MIYLFLQAVFSSIFGLCIKWVGNRNKERVAENIFVVGALNYIIAALAILPVFLMGEAETVSSGAIWTGAVMGLVYFVAFFFVIYAIRWIGVSSTTVVGVLSIMMPIAVAALFWDQIPSRMQVVGILLALAALILMGWKNEDPSDVVRPWFTPWVMLAFFLLCGCSRIAQDAFNFVTLPDGFDPEVAGISEEEFLSRQKPTFLLSAFVASAIPSIGVLIYVWGGLRKKVMATEVLFGIGLGLTNLIQLFFVLKCLQYYPGYIVFPVTSAGGILLTTLVAVSVLGEKLSAKTYVGIAIAVVALFLLHDWFATQA